MERKYKDSGIEWIGKIPETWEVTKLLNVLKSPISDGPHETPSLVENGIPFISVDSLNDSDKVDLSVVRKFISYQDFQEYSKKSKIEKGDILFSKAATIGKTAIVGDETFMVWSPLAIIKTNNNRVNNKFIYHVLNCHRLILYISFLGTYNTQINVGMRALERAIIPLPPLSNQHRIADYLDEKCVEIDSLIALQEQMIEKLKAYKQSVITEAVTKGLDPNAKLVPSGIDWIGEIPEGWSLAKMDYICSVITDFVASGSFESLRINVPYLDSPDYAMLVRTADLSGSAKSDKRVYISKHSYEFLSNSNLFGGEIVLPNIGAVGDAYIVPLDLYDKMSLAPNAIMFKTKYVDKYYYYYFSDGPGSQSLKVMCQATAQPKFNKTQLRGLQVVLPPIEEQKKTVNYLDSKCADIDRLIALKQQKIEALKEYKKSVIYEAVTGKTEI